MDSKKHNIWLKSLLGVLLSVFFLYIALRKVDWGEVWVVLQEVSILWVLPAFFITIIVCLVRALRWFYLFSPVQRMRYSNLFSVIMIGFLANNVLPARLGDLAMAHYIGEKEGVSKSLAFGTILLDRIMDVTTLLFLLIVALVFQPFPGWVNRIAYLGALFLLLILVMIFALIFYTDQATHAINFILKPIPRVISLRFIDILSRLVIGFSSLKDIRIVIKVFLISILIWILLGVGVYFLFKGFHFNISFWACFFVLAVVNLGLIIPSSPGFLGTFQFFCISALMLFGISKTNSLGFSIIYHLSQYVPTTILGFVYLARLQVQLGNLFMIIKKEHSKTNTDM
ncbi:MAG: flippase-like domain-containing protein [Desulfatiglans sp.]|jgi:uncharacterized protein (TIRG00374 family)|nr:flippase-like domain-containing protein [Desulfatiglans sp.]